MIVLSSGDKLTLEHVPDEFRQDKPAVNSPGIFPGGNRITDVEKELIQKVLQETKGNKSLASGKLGISRRTLYRKLDEYKIS